MQCGPTAPVAPPDSGGWGDVDFHASNYRGSDHAVLTMTTRD